MKKILFVIIVFLTSITSYSQDNKGDLLKLDLGILNKIRLTYEHPIKSTRAFTFGSSADFYFGSFPGIKIEPFGRVYFGGLAPEGLYLQARFLYGSFNKEFIYYRDGFTNSNSSGYLESIYKKTSISSTGGGLDLGYQWLSGRNNNIVIDLSLGTQFMSDINNTIKEGSYSYSTTNVGFLTTGPGAIFNPHLSIGYRF